MMHKMNALAHQCGENTARVKMGCGGERKGVKYCNYHPIDFHWCDRENKCCSITVHSTCWGEGRGGWDSWPPVRLCTFVHVFFFRHFFSYVFDTKILKCHLIWNHCAATGLTPHLKYCFLSHFHFYEQILFSKHLLRPTSDFSVSQLWPCDQFCQKALKHDTTDVRQLCLVSRRREHRMIRHKH